MPLNDRERAKRVTINVKVAYRLRVLRTASMLSQQAMANRLKISRGRYAMIEAGNRPLDLATAIAICDAMSVDANYLLQDDAERLSPELKSRMRKAERMIAFGDVVEKSGD